MQLEGWRLLAEGREEEAVVSLTGTCLRFAALGPPQYGPIFPIEPCQEALAAAQLAAGRPREALAAAQQALALHPKRTPAVVLAAKAATAVCNLLLLRQYKAVLQQSVADVGGSMPCIRRPSAECLAAQTVTEEPVGEVEGDEQDSAVAQVLGEWQWRPSPPLRFVPTPGRDLTQSPPSLRHDSRPLPHHAWRRVRGGVGGGHVPGGPRRGPAHHAAPALPAGGGAQRGPRRRGGRSSCRPQQGHGAARGALCGGLRPLQDATRCGAPPPRVSGVGDPGVRLGGYFAAPTASAMSIFSVREAREKEDWALGPCPVVFEVRVRGGWGYPCGTPAASAERGHPGRQRPCKGKKRHRFPLTLPWAAWRATERQCSRVPHQNRCGAHLLPQSPEHIRLLRLRHPLQEGVPPSDGKVRRPVDRPRGQFGFTCIARHSFKERGARNALMLLTADERKRGVIAASAGAAGPRAAGRCVLNRRPADQSIPWASANAGNHALGLAFHGKDLGVPITVIMPEVAPITKVQKCRELGANVVVQGAHIGESKDLAMEYVERDNLTYVNGYDHPNIIAGAGSIGLEVLDQVPDVEAVLVPLGGGGLIAGMSLAIKSMRPDVEVIVRGAARRSAPLLRHGVLTPTHRAVPRFAGGGA